MTEEYNAVRTGGSAPWVEPHGDTMNFGTTHLPEDVVRQPFYVAMEMVTDAENPRLGGAWFSVRMGQRDNPKLTSEERDYILKSLSFCLERLSSGDVSEYPEESE